MNMGLMNYGDMPPVSDPLQPNYGTSPAQAAPLPAPSVPDRPSLLQRIGHALSAAEGGVSNAIRPSAPVGYDALGLSPDEIAAARPSLLHSLIGGPDALNSQDQYAANLNGIVQRKQAGIAMQRQQELLKGRRDFSMQNPMPMSGDESEMAPYVNKALAYFANNGDTEMMQRLTPLADAFAKAHAARVPGQLFQNKVTHEVRSFDTSAGQTIPQGWDRMSAAASGAWKQYMDKQGHVHVLPESQEPPQDYSPVSTNNIMLSQAATDRRFDLTDMNKQVGEFNKSNAPITKAAAFYPGFKAASQQALAGNPAAFKTIMSQMAAQLDPALQLRLGTLLYVQNIDPSFKGNLQRYLSEKSSGTLPPEQVKRVIQVVDAVRKEQRDLYEKRRGDLVNNFPAADKYAHSAEDVFGSDVPTPTAPGNDLYSRYGLTPRKK